MRSPRDIQHGPEDDGLAIHTPRRPPRGTDAQLIGPQDVHLGVRRYEELEGGEGRGVFFRPHRYSAADLEPLRCTVVVLLDGERHEFVLRDVSQNGAAFIAPEGVAFVPQQAVQIALIFDGYEAFRGEALVGSVREQDSGSVVGVSFGDYLLDVEEVLQLRSVQRWTASRAFSRVPGHRWRVEGHDRYRALVAELRIFFEDARIQLDALEARLPWHVLHGGENPAREALVNELRAGFAADALRLSEEIDAAVREVPDGYASVAAKEWSRRHLDEFLMESPGCHRARHKPFGYPGDYEVMNFMYGDPFVGSTLFARAVQLAFNHTRAAKAVRARKDLVRAEVAALVAVRAASQKPVRILSIAAGPAQELVELFDGWEDLPVPVEVVLFEQDKNALAHAWRRLQAQGRSHMPRKVRATFLHDSIKRLLRDGAIFAPFGGFDLVYCCGLYDYLARRTAVALTRHLARAAAPGGRVLIANMVDHPTRWLMEFHLDWLLVYRTREELLGIGAEAVPGAQIRILEEWSRANPFVDITLPVS